MVTTCTEKSGGKAKSSVSFFKNKNIKIFFTNFFSHFIFLDAECFKSKWIGVFFSNTVLPSNFEKYYPEPLNNPRKNLTLKEM